MPTVINLSTIKHSAEGLSPVAASGSFNDLADKPTIPYDIAFSVYEKPANSEVVLRFRASRSYTLAGDQTSGQAKSGVAATGSTVFTVAKNGTQIGTVTFTAGNVTGTINVTESVFAVGDLLSVTAPATADATLADTDFTFNAVLA